MKIKEILTEGGTGSLQTSVAHAMPNVVALPGLKNQDMYLQYRMGLALASARARAKGEIPFETESAFGENMIVVARTPEEEEQLDLALKLMGGDLAQKKVISTRQSEEGPDVDKISVIGSKKRSK